MASLEASAQQPATLQADDVQPDLVPKAQESQQDVHMTDTPADVNDMPIAAPNDTEPAAEEASKSEEAQTVSVEHGITITKGDSGSTELIADNVPEQDEASIQQEPEAATPATSSITAKAEKPTARHSTAVASANTNGTSSNGAETRIYLQEQVNEWLLQGMRWLAYVKPKDGLSALAEYLQSAAEWHKEVTNVNKTPAEYQKHWQAYQTWKASNSGLSMQDYQKSQEKSQ